MCELVFAHEGCQRLVTHVMSLVTTLTYLLPCTIFVLVLFKFLPFFLVFKKSHLTS